MISKMPLVMFGLVGISILVQAAPFRPIKQNIPLPDKTPLESTKLLETPTTTASISTKASSNSDIKKKRNIEDYIPFDAFLDNDSSSEERDIKIEHKLHPKMKETPAQIHDNAAKPVDTDRAEVFTEIKMDSNDLPNLARRRRHDPSSQRRKRALSSYELYATDPLLASVFERQQFVRPARAFSPTYWYPSIYERSIRSALPSSYYDRPEWNRFSTGDLDDDQDILFNDDDDDDRRYQALLEPLNNPYNTAELQPSYDIYDDDDRLSLDYEPVDGYWKK